MKKLFCILTAVLLIATAKFANAVEVGNFTNGVTFEVKGERTTRQVELKKPFNVHSYTEEGEYTEGGYSETESITGFDGEETIDRIFAKLSAPITDRVSIYGKLGGARLRLDTYNLTYSQSGGYPGGPSWSWSEQDSNLDRGQEEGYNSCLFGGIGTKAVLYQSGDFKLGVDGQYLYQKSDGWTWSKERYSYTSGTYWSKSGESYEITEVTTQEAHLALLMSTKAGKFSPYAGAKLSWYESKYEGKTSSYQESSYGTYDESTSTSFSFKTQQKDYAGIFIGCDYNFTEKVIGNFELQLLDNTAVAVGIGYLF